MVGDLGGEGIVHKVSRGGSSSDKGDKKEGLAGFWDTGDGSESRRWKDTNSEVRRG